GGPVDGYWSTDSNTLVITNVNGDHTPMYGTLLKKPQARATASPLWICGPPVVEKGSQIEVRAANDGSASFTITEKGKTGTASFTWSGIPKQVREGEKVTLRVSATGSEPSHGMAGFNISSCYNSSLYNPENKFNNWAYTETGGKRAPFDKGEMVFL